MSLVDKMKKLFLEEDEVPVKSEVMHVEIPAPAPLPVKEVEVPKPEVKPEPVVVKEEKATPIFFDDNYFKEFEKPKPKPEIKTTYKKEIIPREEKKFKPTPIISPVYGVLNKNYNKEDIIEKNEMESVYKINSGITIDDVRKKAYGTLEDELESNLFENDNYEPKHEFFEDLIDLDTVNEQPISESEIFNLIDTMYEKGDE